MSEKTAEKMIEKKKIEVVENEKVQHVRKEAESTYAARELAQHARGLFGVSHDIAKAALDHAHVDICTINKARKIIDEFRERKVM